MNQLAKVTDALKHVTRYTYDQTGSLLIQNVGDGQTVESSYNDVGKVTEVSGAEGSITYQYDERGYLLSVENVNGDVVSYTYDEYGNRTSMTYPDGRVVSYTYDRMNRMTGVTGLDGEVTTYTYDAAGRRTETSGSTLTTSYRYDSVGNLVEQVTHGESEIAFSYAYDRNGYLTGEIRRENGTTVASSYAYDAAGQLTEFLQTTGYGERYAYDKAGNMTEKVLTGTDGAETTLAMKYNKANQLVSMANGRDKIAYKYDKNGSMVQKVLSSQTYGKLTDSYAYNALDQLTEYVGYDGYRQAFTYDANGMRQSKSEAGDANRSTLEELLRGNVAGLPEIVEPAQSQTNADEADMPAGLEWATTEYLYDLTQEYYQVISETTTYANGTSATTAYAYGLERIAAYSENGVTRYVYDGRGSVAQAVNVPVAGEAVSSNLPDISVKVQSFTYTAFGEQMGGVKAGGFTYNAEAYDAATGMLNLRARQYEPALNRFSQKDIYPANLLIPQSFNAYLFTYNSPVGFVDGDGLSAKSLGSVLSSIGSKVQKVVSGIGNTVKTVATAIFGEKVVNTVVSGVKSVARTIRKAAQPIVDTVSTAWNKATQMYREAQEEISRLDKTAPDYHLQVDAIYRSICARYMGGEEETTTVFDRQMYIVENSKNEYNWDKLKEIRNSSVLGVTIYSLIGAEAYNALGVSFADSPKKMLEEFKDWTIKEKIRETNKKEEYSYSTWMAADINKKKEILQNYTNELIDIYDISIENSIQFFSEGFGEDGGITLGYYQEKFGLIKRIAINEYVLQNDISGSSVQLFSTIRHELRHAYQHAAVNNPNNYIVSQETLEQWKYNMNNPVSATEDYWEYRKQQNEIDAREFGDIQ